jgi:6-phosphogluconate dehydrogenase
VWPLSSQPAEFVKSIKRPRKIVLLVMAGKPVDSTIELLSQYLEVRHIRDSPR